MATNTYVALETTTLGSNTQYVEFTSIPQTYTDLIIVCNAKDSGGGTVNTNAQVGNSTYDTGSNYSWTWLGGSGTTAASGRGSNVSSYYTGAISTTSNSPTILQFMNYANTTTYKTMLSRNSLADASSGQSVSAWVGLWRSTAAINQIRVFPGGQTFAAGSTFTLYGIAAASVGAKATGGTISYGADGYVYHTFTSTGTFTPSTGLTADVLTIAGGGGAGANHGGGGGAGGLLYTSGSTFTATGYTVTVGAGGSAAVYPASIGTNGVNSSINGLVAIGGGRGGDYSNDYEAYDGGSGGGARSNGTSYIGLGTSGQGNNGGGKNPNYGLCGGGGGGAGGVGETPITANSGAGGVGLSTYSQWGNVTNTGQSVSGVRYYAGGGGGGGWNGSIPVGTYALGGYGGGGQSGPVVSGGSSNGTAGTANTGGGGGCGGGGTSSGGAGGSGIVIVRYLG